MRRWWCGFVRGRCRGWPAGPGPAAGAAGVGSGAAGTGIASRSPAPALPRPVPPPRSFPIPFVIAGRWCLPLPARTHLKYVVGQPVEAPPLAVPGKPSEAEVEAAHAAFYDALRALWHRHAPSHPGYADVKLVVV